MAHNETEMSPGCENPYTAYRPHGAGKWLVGVILVLFTASALAVHPYQRWAEEFGIDVDVSYDGTRLMEIQGSEMEMKEHKAPGKMYTEVYIGDMTSGVILREDLEKAYILIPSMGFYKEESLKNGMLQASNDMEFSKIEKVGPDNINGHPSTKFKVRFKDKQGKGAGHIWITDTGIAIKMDMIYSSRGEKGQRVTMQFTELNIRKQDPRIFELPPDLKPMSFGNIMGFGQTNGQNAEPAGSGAESSGSTDSASGDLAQEQVQCLFDASEAARSGGKEKKRFGRFMSKMKSAAAGVGVSKAGSVAKKVYAEDATDRDIAEGADELGITVSEVERCRAP